MFDRVCKVACGLVLTALHTTAHAQGSLSPGPYPSVGASIQGMSPRGEFRQNSGDVNWQHRGGIGFDVIAPLVRSGLLSLRVDYMFGSYDKDCYGCRRGFNSISFGPEVLVTLGPVHPYAMGAWGRFNLESFEDASGAKADTGAGQWIYGGGVRIQVTSTSRYLLDVGIRSHRVGTVTYLGRTGIQHNPDGSVTVDSARSSIPFAMYSVGFQYRFK